jgi:hypothetical protein
MSAHPVIKRDGRELVTFIVVVVIVAADVGQRSLMRQTIKRERALPLHVRHTTRAHSQTVHAITLRARKTPAAAKTSTYVRADSRSGVVVIFNARAPYARRALSYDPPASENARLITPATIQAAPAIRAGAAFSFSKRAPRYAPINVASSRAGATWLIGAICMA